MWIFKAMAPVEIDPPLDVPHEEPSKLTGQVVLIFGPSQYADALDHRDN